jgi:hypothetical protein
MECSTSCNPGFSATWTLRKPEVADNPLPEDCRAATAFQAWHSVNLTPSFNVTVSFADWKIVPKGKRAVIELVTAQIIVPSGEWAR